MDNFTFLVKSLKGEHIYKTARNGCLVVFFISIIKNVNGNKTLR